MYLKTDLSDKTKNLAVLRRFSLLLAIIVGIVSNIFGQYQEDFSDNQLTDWYSGSYILKAENQILKINPVKDNVWAGFGVSFATINIKEFPFVTLKIKSNIDFNISAAIGVKNGKIDNYPLKFNTILVVGAQEVVAGSEFQEYSFDFTGLTDDVLSNISNLHFVLNPLTQEFGSAPNKEIWFDDIRVGSVAVRTPEITNIGDQYFTVLESGTLSRKVAFRNVTDGTTGTNPVTITATSSNTTVIPNPVVEYTSPGKTGTLVLNPVLQTAGESVISVNVSAPNTTSKTMTFKVGVLPNVAPSMQQLPDILVKSGDKVTVRLTKINDGNPESNQNISITGVCSNTAIIPKIDIQHDSTDFTGIASFTVSTDAQPGTTDTITLTLKDNGGTASGGEDSASYTFKITVFDDLNNQPTLDSLPPLNVKAIAGKITINLTGISDGDGSNQKLEINAGTPDNKIVSSVEVGPVNKGSAPLYLTLTGSVGKTVVSVTVTDNGGAPGNNGNQTTTRKFELTTLESAVTGVVLNYKPFIGNIGASGLSTSTDKGIVEILDDGVVHIKGTVMPQTWPANWFHLFQHSGGKEIDMSSNKRVSFKFKGASTMKIEAPGTPSKLGKTLIYFRLIDNIDPGTPTSGYLISSVTLSLPNDDQWHDVYLDYEGKFGKDKDGKQTDSTRISRLMLDINTTWFQQIGVDCYFKDIKVGDKAEVPIAAPVATIDNIAAQTFYKGENAKPVKLTGITDGMGNNTAALSISTNKPSVITNITADSVVNGTSMLYYSIDSNVTDSAVITVIAKNTLVPESKNDTAKFKVYIVDKELIKTETVTINKAEKYQTVAGIGCFIDNSNREEQIQAINDLNITVMRCTSDGEFEPVNDNSDSNVQEYSRFNLAAIPTEAIRNINENTNCHKFFFTIWTPPSWMKQNKGAYPSTDTQWAPNNRLKPEMYEEFAEYVIAICKTVKELAGVELYAISLQNEPTFNEPYVSCQYNGEEFRELLKVVGPRMKAENLSTRIMLSEDVNAWGWVQSNVSPANADPLSREYIDIVACHNYDPDGIRPGSAGVQAWSSLLNFKNTTPAEGLWMTETSGYSNIWEGEWGKDYLSGKDQFFPGPLDFAAAMFNSFKSGNISSWVDLDRPVDKLDNDLLGGVFKNYSKFLIPGAVMIDAQSNGSDVMSLAFQNPDNSISVVLLNRNSKPVKAKIQGQGLPGYFQSYTTQNLSAFTAGTVVADGDILLPARSITTLINSNANAAPTVNHIKSTDVILRDGDVKISLSGIGYGPDKEAQSVVSVKVVTQNNEVANASISYLENADNAELTISPFRIGTTYFTITVKDDGGIENNGIDSTSFTFAVNVKTAVGIKDVNKVNVKLYPNPANDYVMVTLENGMAERIMMRDISGKIVADKIVTESTNELKLSVAELPKGFYFVTVITKDEQRSLKFIKE